MLLVNVGAPTFVSFLPAAKPGRSISQFWPPLSHLGKGESQNEGFPEHLGIEECQNEGLSRTFEIDLIPVFEALIHNQNVNKIKMNC